MNRNYLERKAHGLIKGVVEIAYLEVPQIRAGCIEKADRGKLNCRIQAHVLETAEACDQGSSALTN